MKVNMPKKISVSAEPIHGNTLALRSKVKGGVIYALNTNNRYVAMQMTMLKANVSDCEAIRAVITTLEIVLGVDGDPDAFNDALELIGAYMEAD